MITSHNDEKLNSTVALLDVDETLFVDQLNVDPDVDNVESVKGKILAGGVLNVELILALKASQVKDVYLFTDMTFTVTSMLERKALVAILKDYGFTVHGVATPADLAWDLPLELLKAFYNSTSSKLPKEIDWLNRTYKRDEAKVLTDQLESDETYKKLVSKLNSVGSLPPGSAFKTVEEVNEESKSEDSNEAFLAFLAFAKRCRYAKAFVDAMSVVEGISHVKGSLFYAFLKHNNKKYSKYIVCDDNQDVLKSIKQGNEKHLSDSQIDTITIYVNNNFKKIAPGEIPKSKASYLREINAPDVLNKACKVYIDHLSMTLEEKRKNGSTYENDKNYALALRKRTVVQSMYNKLGNTVGDEQLRDFHKEFNEHRALLETRRDSAAMLFLKTVLTVFSLGLVAFFGIWKVKGEEFVKTVAPYLPEPVQSKSALQV